MDGHAPANQLRLSLPGADRVKPERNWERRSLHWRNVTRTSGPSAQVTEPPYADPHVRWCDRESWRQPTYVDFILTSSRHWNKRRLSSRFQYLKGVPP